MKRNRLTTILLIIVSGLLLAACTGAPMEASWPGVTATDEMAYIANGMEVYAVRINDGSLAWRYPEKTDTARVYYAAPALGDGHLIVGDYKDKLVSLDPQNGNFQWEYDQAKGGFIGSPLTLDGMVYAPSTDHNLYAMDVNRNYRWTFTAQNMLWAHPVVDGNLIYQAGMDRKLYAIDRASGVESWSMTLNGAMIAPPAIDSEGNLYIGTTASEMVAIEAATRTKKWSIKTDGMVWSQPLVNNGTIFFGDMTGKVYALDRATGNTKWTLVLNGPVIAAPILVGEKLIFVTETGDIQAVSQEGVKVWAHSVEKSQLYSTPVVADEKILVPVTMGKDGTVLVAVDFNGNQLWSFAPPKK